MNAELIKALRYCSDNEKQDGCDECPYLHNGMCFTMLSDAAYALEAAEKRIAELEAQLPKEGEWIDADGANVPLDKDGDTTDSCYCSICGDWLTASDEYAARGWFCPNCGAKMQTVTDCHTLEEGER